jgi:hypothetical protein
VFLIALLVWQVSSTGFSQGALGDSSMRREALRGSLETTV